MAQNVLLPELRKNAIQFDIRKLQVGDFLWVAKPRHSGNLYVILSILLLMIQNLAGQVSGKFLVTAIQ